MIVCAWGWDDPAGGRMTYSHFVNTLKVVLSLLALALLSTLFLVQQKVGEGESTIPFADIELEKRLKGQQVTAPFFSGKTSQGHLVAFTAETAHPDENDAGQSEAKTMTAQIDLADGSRLSLASDRALIHNQSHNATLDGNVKIVSSNGYTINSETLISNMRELQIESPETVTGTGPAGDFTAGRMQIKNGKEDDEVYLFFTKGVKLIYTPEK